MITLTLIRQPKRVKRCLKSVGWCTVNKSTPWQQPGANAIHIPSQSLGFGGLQPDQSRQLGGAQVFFHTGKGWSEPPTGSTFVLRGLDWMDNGIKLWCTKECQGCGLNTAFGAFRSAYIALGSVSRHNLPTMSRPDVSIKLLNWWLLLKMQFRRIIFRRCPLGHEERLLMFPSMHIVSD